jgi:sirohydrochlorin cobaltochelatase
MKAALVLVAHGSRDPEWARPLQAIEARARALRADLDVRLSFLDLTPPAPEASVREAAQAGATAIYLAPMFLGEGAHARRDMADLVDRLRGEYPGLLIELLPAAGEFVTVLDAIAGAVVRTVPLPSLKSG